MATTFQKLVQGWKIYSGVIGATMVAVVGGNGYNLYQQQKQLRGYPRDYKPMQQIWDLVRRKDPSVEFFDRFADIVVASDKFVYGHFALMAISFKTFFYGWAWPYTAYKVLVNPNAVFQPYYIGFIFRPAPDRDGFIKQLGSNTITYVPYVPPSDETPAVKEDPTTPKSGVVINPITVTIPAKA